jgi:Fic family protein
MQKYIWQQAQWPHFTWDERQLSRLLGQVRLHQGRLIQKMNLIVGNDLKRSRAVILEQETLKTALIEGEKYDPLSVRSSIHARLNLPHAGLPRPSRQIDGLIDVILDAVSTPSKPLKKSKLYAWHATLFPTGYSQLVKIRAGLLRDDQSGPMQVVSGAIGHEKVHYQAPPAAQLSQEITTFLSWWNRQSKEFDGVIRAGLAHFYFVTIHPFDDGNGRLARVITDMALAQDDHALHRYYSLSSAIMKHKAQYYKILEECQKGNLDLTPWLTWFLKTFLFALQSSDFLLKDIFAKTAFWHKYQHLQFSDRQRKVLNKIMDAEHGGFVGGLTTTKYLHINHTISRSTAIREIQELVKLKILLPNQSQGRSTSYRLNW